MLLHQLTIIASDGTDQNRMVIPPLLGGYAFGRGAYGLGLMILK